MDSALYFGTLRHRRFRPIAHEFTYNVFMAFLDIDRIPELMSRSSFSSHNGFNWASFHDADHFGDPRLHLRRRILADASQQGIELPNNGNGPIFLLTHLRYLGYNFNPISLYYCCNENGEPHVILAEVNSTFGERRNYWLSAANRRPEPSNNSLRYRCPKDMHVSPFMPMNLEYAFALTPPAGQLVAHMETLDQHREDQGPLFDATLNLHRRDWTAATLRHALLRHPWMTAKVIAAIHWQALKLYTKGAPVFTHPAKL